MENVLAISPRQGILSNKKYLDMESSSPTDKKVDPAVFSKPINSIDFLSFGNTSGFFTIETDRLLNIKSKKEFYDFSDFLKIKPLESNISTKIELDEIKIIYSSKISGESTTFFKRFSKSLCYIASFFSSSHANDVNKSVADDIFYTSMTELEKKYKSHFCRDLFTESYDFLIRNKLNLVGINSSYNEEVDYLFSYFHVDVGKMNDKKKLALEMDFLKLKNKSSENNIRYMTSLYFQENEK